MGIIPGQENSTHFRKAPEGKAPGPYKSDGILGFALLDSSENNTVKLDDTVFAW